MVHLSCAKRAKILELRHTPSGKPRSISEIAHITGHCRETVRLALQRVGETGTLHYDKPHPGRPRHFTPRDLNHCKLVLARGEAQNATEAQHLACPDRSARTVRRRLSEAGLPGRVRREKPYLSPLNWKLVVFSDESKFNLFGSDGRQWVRRRVGEEFLDRNVKKKVQGGGGSIMVWGCITANGVGRLHRINGIMDAKKYCAILEQSLLGTLHDHHLSPSAIIFQQDNDRKHTSKLAQHWFEDHHITVLPWPSSSPDMNIIEHVWGELKRRVHARNPLPRNREELWTALQEEWYGLSPSFIQSLYDSLPRRVKALKDAKGSHTPY
ncbi:hypothetical protein ONZ51_g10558 [Trametes cubensis]|uniref:Tc1-like transposase DDE domain-containing protein n=1 Tax=Trametes cubensis TaxID=1111947 RepID=A0AAD7TKZ9_9APHY|nr:hypothetical protein ONZ51_g10558 [Trametes cubensis]